MNDFKKVFISHRSYDREKAKKFRTFLLENNISEQVVLWEEESLCRNNEQLTVHDYFEAIERIRKSMVDCTAFLYIDSPVFFNGYFTSAEVLLWKRLQEYPCIYCIKENGNGYSYEKRDLDPLSKREKYGLGYVAFLINPDRAIDTEGGVFLDSWGKYAKECFLVGCCSCGHYYLVTEKKLNYYAQSGIPARCPHCGKFHAKFYFDKGGKKFFGTRNPILLKPIVERLKDLEPLSVNEVINLFTAKKLPERFLIDKMEGEKLVSDYQRLFKGCLKYLGFLTGAIVGVTKVLSILDGEKEK